MHGKAIYGTRRTDFRTRGECDAHRHDGRIAGGRRAHLGRGNRHGSQALPHALRDRARKHPLRIRRIRSAGAVQPLDARQSVSSDEDDVRLRPLENLRAGHQHEPVLRLSARYQRLCAKQADYRPRAWALRLLRQQRLLRPHFAPDARYGLDQCQPLARLRV